jgi:nitroreductase
MELKEAIEQRASVRQFASDNVDIEDLKEMVRLAHLAPSVNNSQPWRFIAITNRELMKQMADAVRAKVHEVLPDSDEEKARKVKSQVEWFSTFFESVPAVIAVVKCPYEAIVDCALDKGHMTHEDMNAMRGCPDIESIGACIENLMLAAVDMGYGTCWLSGPLVARNELESILELKGPWTLEAMVAVGKPLMTIHQREKKPLEEVFELRA